MSSSPKSLARMIVALTRTVQGLSRTQQFSRSTITTTQGETRTVGDVLDEATETAGTVEGHNEDLSYLDETTWDALDDIAGQYDFGERQSDAHFEQWDSTVYAMELTNQLEETLAEAERQRLAAKEVLEAELAEAQRELNSAKARVAGINDRLESTEQTVGGMDTRITKAVNDAADAQVKAVLAQGLLTVETRAPVAADGQGKKVGAVWMHRTGAALTTLYEWTSLGWVPRPLSEQIIPQVAIGTGTYGLMSGERLEARSVTAEKVLITSGQNELWDPTYTAWNTSAWANPTSGVTGPGGGWDTDFVRPGAAASQRLHQYASGTSNASLYSFMRSGINFANKTNTDRLVYVGNRRGEKLTAYSHWFVDKALPTGFIELSTQIYFYNAAGSQVGNTSTGRVSRTNVKIGEWQRVGGTQLTVPATAEYAITRPTAYFTNGTTQVNDAKFWLGGEELYWANAGELIVDGSIQSRHTATGFLEALVANISQAFIRTGHIIDLDVSKLVATNATISQAVVEKLFADVVVAKLLTVTEKIITRDIIADNAITGRTIAANAIDGMTITGALMRTAPSGRRIQLDVNGLRAFNSSGRETARLMSEANGLEIYSPRGGGIASIGEMPMPGSSSGSTQQVNVSQPNAQGINSIVDISANSAGGAHVMVAGGGGGQASLVADGAKSRLIVDEVLLKGRTLDRNIPMWDVGYFVMNMVANQRRTYTLTWPPGYWKSTPQVVASPNSGAPDVLSPIGVTNISLTQAVFNMRRTDSTNTGVRYIAMQADV